MTNSENYDKNKIIRNFLKQVENRLPGWLVDIKQEKEDVLNELEEHILDKASEIAQGREPTAYDIQQAIDSMGSPTAIAREYKKRGTPKVWISEEFFPWYKKGLQVILAVVFVLNIITFAINAFKGNFWEALLDFSTGLGIGVLTGAIILTLIFVALSMEGFLPEDFKEMAEEERNKGTSHKKFGGKDKKPKPPLKRGELLSDAIFGTIFGIFMMTMPVASINEYLGAEMVAWIQIAGIFSFINAIISFMQSLIGLQMIGAQRVFIAGTIAVDLIFIPRVLLLESAVLSIPAVVALEAGTYSVVATVFHWIPYIAVFGTVISTIERIVKIITLKSKYDRYQAEIDRA